ncbi:YeeE/YedE family protein [Aquabacterium sp. OR-4]|uniref:YeeE/YedE family protein n=1 Tax=Aquabacterium sp. OR-4 TaxID=2978127 RepID=UPI0021B1CD5E|nr:YeeE/YedE family protein [Aquabacterium sp. OR-4]MDT7836249.1 YeeE/YedE family protein [Aquabacterium sp. OR-4]
MSESDLPVLTRQLLWAAFALGAGFGALARHTHFCTMGAVADWLLFGGTARWRMWLLAMAVAMLGFNLLVASGAVRAADTIYAGTALRWLSLAVGGGLFGVGMVLASGCGARTLVRLGGGNLRSLVVVLVAGLAAWASIRGALAVARIASIDQVQWLLPGGADLPTLAAGLGGTPAQRAGVLGCLCAAALAAWVLARRDGRQPEVLAGGIGLGALVVAMWWLTGVHGHLAEHPQTLEPAFLATNSQRMESFSFIAPMAYLIEWLIYATDGSRVFTQGMAAALGVVAGSAAVALATRSFRWEGFGGAADTGRHLAGAVLMGAGGVTALGCTVGQGLSGVSTLSIGSVLALAGMLGGATLALRWQMRQAEAG